MLSSNRIEEIKNYSQKEYWERLRELKQATQRTEEEEAELVVLKEEMFSRDRQKLLDRYKSEESVSRRNDIEEMDQLMEEISPKFKELDPVRLKVNIGGMCEELAKN